MWKYVQGLSKLTATRVYLLQMSVLFNLKFVQSNNCIYHLVQTFNLVWASDKIRPSLNIANRPSWSLSLLGSKTEIEGSGIDIVQMTFVQYKTQYLHFQFWVRNPVIGTGLEKSVCIYTLQYPQLKFGQGRNDPIFLSLGGLVIFKANGGTLSELELRVLYDSPEKNK